MVLDVVLPDGDGVELLGEIRAQPRSATLPVSALSTEAEVNDRIRGLHTGADEYVGKPYDAGYVVSRARELVASPGADRQRRPSCWSSTTAPPSAKSCGERSSGGLPGPRGADTGEEGLRTPRLSPHGGHRRRRHARHRRRHA